MRFSIFFNVSPEWNFSHRSQPPQFKYATLAMNVQVIIGIELVGSFGIRSNYTKTQTGQIQLSFEAHCQVFAMLLNYVL